MASMLHEMAQIATHQGIASGRYRFLPCQDPQSSAARRTQSRHSAAHRRAVGIARAPTHKMSALQDLEQGKRLEVEETLGYAVQQGVALGIPTPTMDVCYNLIAGINHYLQ